MSSTGVTGAATPESGHTAARQAGDRGPRGAWGAWGVRGAWVLGTTAVAVALFTCYLLQSRTIAAGSDGASITLQAWDMLHGNPLLRGWWVADVSFYTTELPEYALVESVRGLSADVMHIAGAMTYTLLVLLAAYLARGRARGRAGLVRALLGGGIMLAPQLGSATGTLLLGPDHTGTGVVVLAVLLLADLAPARWYVPVLAGVLLTWGLVTDRLVLFIGVVPIVAVCAARVAHGAVVRREGLRAWWYEASLAVAAVVSVPVAFGATALIKKLGGWQINPLNPSLATAGMLGHNFRLAGQGLLELFGADFTGAGPGSGSGRAVGFAAVHLIGVALVAWACCVAVRRLLRRDSLIEAVCVAAIVVNVAAYLAGVQAVNIASTREIAAVLPLGAVLAGRLFGERMLAARAGLVFGAVLAGYAAMLGFGAAQPAAAPQYADLTSWLQAHDLTSGVSGYSQANIVTVESHGAISLRPVVPRGGFIAASTWEANGSWFDPARHSANYLVLSTFGAYEVTARQAVATFGAPTRTYRFRTYQIMVWDANLFTRLR